MNKKMRPEEVEHPSPEESIWDRVWAGDPTPEDIAQLRADCERLDWLDYVQSRADQASVESITSKLVQQDGYYTTWTIKRHGEEPVTARTFREVVDKAMGRCVNGI